MSWHPLWIFHRAVAAWTRADRNNAGIAAAAIAFFAMLGLVPGLTAISLICGWLGDPREVLAAFRQVGRALPPATAHFAIDQMAVVLAGGAREGAIAVLTAIGVGLYGLMNAAQALIAGLNLAYRLTERRGFFHRTGVTMAMAAGTTISVVALLTTLVLVGRWSKGLHEIHTAAVAVIFLGAAAFAILVTGQVYVHGPSRVRADPHPVLPGAVVAVVLSLIISAGFGFYAENFANFAATYGLMAGIAPIMLWLQLCGYALLLGAAVNAEIKLRDRDQPRDDSPAHGEAMPAKNSDRLGS
jgi:membrane protein